MDERLTSGCEAVTGGAHAVVPGGAFQQLRLSRSVTALVHCAVLLSRDGVGVAAVGTDLAHRVVVWCPCRRREHFTQCTENLLNVVVWRRHGDTEMLQRRLRLVLNSV